MEVQLKDRDFILQFVLLKGSSYDEQHRDMLKANYSSC